MIVLNLKEKSIKEAFINLKKQSGTHSPSISTLQDLIPEIKIKIDACFLSNPYATDLFFDYFNEDLLKTNQIYNILEYYPSQNQYISSVLSKQLNVPNKNVFVGNGATEIIQAVIHNLVKEKIIVNIPTFSSYYEFALNEIEVEYFKLLKDNNFVLNVQEYISYVNSTKPGAVVIINPNNPDGGYINYDDMIEIIQNLDSQILIIVDESFIHFSYEDSTCNYKSLNEIQKEYSNLIIIKSMSKDFGIAGIRVGYAIMNHKYVSKLLDNGFLWNSNGIAEYFINTYTQTDFQNKYLKIREKYIKDTIYFFDKLKLFKNFKIYPSKANFILLELIDGSKDIDLVFKLLINYGIYTRVGSDKIGLDGEFVRIASRRRSENESIITALKEIFEESD